MNKNLIALSMAAVLGLAACDNDTATSTPAEPDKPTVPEQPAGDFTLANQWFNDGQLVVTDNAARVAELAKGSAKNVILFVGDGMGVSTITAARIFEGQKLGYSGEEHKLSFETLPYVGFAKTYNTDAQTPDSAGTMTAMMTGVKTDAGIINVAEAVERGDCSTVAGHELVSALQLAEEAGMSTGVVSTARLTHATPAATYAVAPDRNWENDTKLPAEATGCKDIASQLIDFNYGNGIEVALGGGRREFLPSTVTDGEGKAGKRGDGRDLTAEWTTKYDNAAYVWDKAGFDAIDAASTDHLLGLFNSSHMQYSTDIRDDVAGEPTLAEMTKKSLEILSRNDKGYFLMVEAGRIDHAHHAGNAYRAMEDTLSLAEAVKVAMDNTSAEDTLIIVTADHGHVMTIAGYPTRGNPILGLVQGNDGRGEPVSGPALDANGMPYTAVGYYNGMGFAEFGAGDNRYGMDIDVGRKDLHGVNVQHPDFHQEALIPKDSESHAGEDVAVFARGPGAALVQGTNEQSLVFHVMNHAADLVGRAEATTK
ncbi:alkaline phosphatase [Gallaecimonas sp. GXIMD4217]|uniref:alkaline phosphatase n=1 Tax=Gallaecimonas sp. GXIMD4217 TaxID=3131927 RepID=UPI00311ACB5F